MKTAPALTAAVALLFAANQPAHAILVDFDIDNGYVVGNLHDQPGSPGSSKWKAPAVQAASGVLSVTANVGVDDTQAIVANSHATLTSATYFLKVTDQDLEDVFDAASSKVSFSFALKWEDISAYANHGRFYVGGNSQDSFNGDVLRIAWMSDGSIIYGVGNPEGSSSFLSVRNSSGNVFKAVAGTFYTIEGVIDYASKTYTLSVNSVEQKDGAGELDLGFFDHDGAQVNPNLVLMSLNNHTTNYRPWVMDNLEIKAIPEPASIALMSGALLGLGGMSWLRNRKSDKVTKL